MLSIDRRSRSTWRWRRSSPATIRCTTCSTATRASPRSCARRRARRSVERGRRGEHSTAYANRRIALARRLAEFGSVVAGVARARARTVCRSTRATSPPTSTNSTPTASSSARTANKPSRGLGLALATQTVLAKALDTVRRLGPGGDVSGRYLEDSATARRSNAGRTLTEAAIVTSPRNRIRSTSTSTPRRQDSRPTAA